MIVPDGAPLADARRSEVKSADERDERYLVWTLIEPESFILYTACSASFLAAARRQVVPRCFAFC